MNSTTRSTRNRTKYNRRAQQCGKVPKVDMHLCKMYDASAPHINRVPAACAYDTHTVIQVEIVQQTAETLCRITNEQQTKGVILKLHSMHVITNIISGFSTPTCRGVSERIFCEGFRLKEAVKPSWGQF